MATSVALRRVYEDVTESDGIRVLVDRLWPRGIAKGDERIHEWYKEVAPSNELRKSFHESGDFVEFANKYRQELQSNNETRRALSELRQLVAQSKRVTFVFASKDEQRNNAVVLKQVLEAKSGR